MLDKASKFLFGLLAALILLSVFSTYWKMMVLKDFTIENDLDEASLEEELETF